MPTNHQKLLNALKSVLAEKEMQTLAEKLTIDWQKVHDSLQEAMGKNEMQIQTSAMGSAIDRINLEKTSDSILSCAKGLKAAVILAQNVYLGSVELSLGDSLHQEQVEDGIFDILAALIDRLHDESVILQDDLGILFHGSESEN